MAGAEKDQTSWTGFLKTQILMGNSTCKHPERPVKQQARTRLLALLSRSPPPAAQGPRLRFAHSWALRSRLGAGGARRTSSIVQQSLKNQKPFSKENQRAPGLTPPSPIGNSSRTTFQWRCGWGPPRTLTNARPRWSPVAKGSSPRIRKGPFFAENEALTSTGVAPM